MSKTRLATALTATAVVIAMLSLWSRGQAASPEAPATGGAAAAAAGPDLCAGLVTDKDAHPQPSLTRPAKGVPYTDPTFGTQVIRITDVKADFGKEIAKPLYPTIPAWNADESRLVLWVRDHGHALYDGRSYKFIRMLDVSPADIEQLYWDPVDPDVLWYPYTWEMSGRSMRQLIRYQVSSNTRSVVYDVPNAGKPRAFKFSNGDDPQYPSWDMKLWGFDIEMPGELHEKFAWFSADRSEGPRVADKHPTPAACPSGHCMWVADRNGSHTLDPKTGTTLRQLNSRGIEHGSLGLNAAGQDFFASVQFDAKPVGTLIVENLQTGAIKPVIAPATGYPYPPTSTHISAVAFKAPGWVAISAVGDPRSRKPLHQEVMLANVDSGRVCRIAHHHSAAKEGRMDYWGEPHVTISPSATRVLFGSDWGGDSVDVYVIELPAYKAGTAARPAKP